jgi:hypothetical protein
MPAAQMEKDLAEDLRRVGFTVLFPFIFAPLLISFFTACLGRQNHLRIFVTQYAKTPGII